jgi:putative glutamine amidotransferase
MSPPRIGITGRVAFMDGADRAGVNDAYVRSVLVAGAVPVILPPVEGAKAIAAMLGGIDGVVFSGGADIEPARYGAKPHPKLGRVDLARDAFEFPLFAEARRRKMPTLAICRGMQLANVALGGTLWQDLPSEHGPHPQSVARTDKAHEVHVIEGSRIGDALGGCDLRVNSFHHQAIRDVAPDLTALAWSEDKVIEAIEHKNGWWFVGVQWHPEEFWGEANGRDLGLFCDLRSAAERIRDGSDR